MKTHLTKVLFVLLFTLSFFSAYAQQGIVSGVLKDNEGYPLPGVNIQIKGTTTGVTTDFDGNYSITCSVGDALVFKYIGFATKEVTVTSDMFGTSSETVITEKVPAELIKSNAYINALENYKSSEFVITSIADSPRSYNRNSSFEHNRIKTIDIKEDKVKLTYFDPDIYFEVGLKTINGFQFVKQRNLPKLQNTYSQGASNNGTFTFQGPETGTVFSYGPQLNLLEFNGASYPYDTNGQLVNIGNGNGLSSNAYDNSIFNASLNATHNLFFNINTNASSFRFDMTHKSQKDLYNKERNNSNNMILKYENNLNHEHVWNAFVKFNSQQSNQPNINGFQNNLLFNTWITPPSFSNNQSSTLPDGTQRSFSPNRFNNPNWLFQNNRNKETHTGFIAALSNELKISEDNTMVAKVNYSGFKNQQYFGVIRNTNGFVEGYLSDRSWNNNKVNALVNFNFEKKVNQSQFNLNSSTDYLYEDLKYSLFQAEGFNDSFNNPQTTISNEKYLFRHVLRLQQKLTYNLNYDDLIIGLSNNSYASSIQKNAWFLPALQVKWKLDDIIDVYDFYNITLSASASRDINDASLLYENLSHNSLNLRPEETLSYREINDLFIDNTLNLEEKQNLEFNFNFQFRALGSHFDFGFTHFTNTTKNTVFPIFENNTFRLDNVANVKNSGVEIALGAYIDFANNFKYYPKLTFSTYRPRVFKVLNNRISIPIAGFSTVSRNLIEGHLAGVIIGSAFARDENNKLIIGSDGFPLVHPEPQIIGNPIPKFNLGFNNQITLHDFTLNFLIDFQKGGDIWNGTQNVLNYFGTSQQSAIERNISNFVFDGVNAQGVTNTVPVDFYNPNLPVSDNRFVRYGFEGIAENAIEDGSYINLKSIHLNYTFKENAKDDFIRSLDVGIYANNLITWTKFHGASPYGNLYDNTSANGLNFFNVPLTSEVGVNINLKI
ncbi:carboxypeptidase-like regulatory domain-containing protein [Hyunsoonleella ulvae]|uniref:carboxypeptidase-like regulatory domain-containing protein n=1 Tax=Hyunsoonleella ulvae TaxID=2799948 RepID=UPI00193AD42D|nr:carboxypeptidase-like regulatory domain-containing protein [Hyunsoonleella ulvae]